MYFLLKALKFNVVLQLIVIHNTLISISKLQAAKRQVCIKEMSTSNENISAEQVTLHQNLWLLDIMVILLIHQTWFVISFFF